MAPRHRRYRHRSRRGNTRLHPAAMVAICLTVAVVATVVVGNLLKRWLDDDTFHRLTVGEETEEKGQTLTPSGARNVNAYVFSFDGELEDILGKTSASVSLNRPDGEMLYASELTRHLGFSDAQKPELGEKMESLVGFIPYISGVFYTNALDYESDGARFAAASEEAALMREFVAEGGSEILVCGLPTDEPDAVLSYLEILRFAVEDVPIGVAVPLSEASSEDGWYVISKLMTVCDFCALDVTGEPTDESDVDQFGVSPSAEQVIARADYYVSAYGMRLLISDRQALLLATLERRMYPNFQVIAYFEIQQQLPENDGQPKE